jgi:hypothetical protein
MLETLKSYYLRPEVVSEMVRFARFREVAPVYQTGYGKRPGCINFERDFLAFVDKGAIEFNGSVELWRNPMLLEVIKDPLKLRIGWDLVIDIDCDFDFELSRMAAIRIVDMLKLHDVKNIHIKFSGNRGFHIAIASGSFPKKVGDSPIEALYPELPKKILAYLKHIIREKLEKDVFSKFPMLSDKNIFDIIHIEENWGARHLFRFPYSLNQKSWLISLPLDQSELRNFKKEDASIDKVKKISKYLSDCEENETNELILQALDFKAQQEFKEELEAIKAPYREFEVPEGALPRNFFPKTILKILEGLEDGRKRALFILITFLRNVGWSWSEIEKEIAEWNARNKKPLNENYIKGQLNWHKKRGIALLPPNFDAPGFYKDMGVFVEEDIALAKNPVNYSLKVARKVMFLKKSRKKDFFRCENCGAVYKTERGYNQHVNTCIGTSR